MLFEQKFIANVVWTKSDRIFFVRTNVVWTKAIEQMLFEQKLYNKHQC